MSNNYWKCYFGCETDGILHRFPNPRKNEERFILWTRVLDSEMQKRDRQYVFNNLRLCDDHFELCYRTPSKILTRNAVPTLNLNSKRQKLFRNVVPSQNIPKRSSDNEVPLAKKIKLISREENRADVRHRKIVVSKKDLGLAIKNEKMDVEDGFEDNNITDDNSHHNVMLMTSSTQVNLVDYRNYRPRDDWSLADLLCDKEPLEKCTQINFLPIWIEGKSALQPYK